MEDKIWRKKMVEDLNLTHYKFDEPMSRLTSFKIGGPADLLVEPETPEELAGIVEYCLEYDIPWIFLGRGSNLLVRDKGVRGVAIRLGKGFCYTKVEGTRMWAGAATPLSTVAEVAAGHSLSGLEFASGIPGSVGGAVFMNAGAYEGEMCQVVVETKLYKPGEGFLTLKKEELCFGYRRSRLQQEKLIALQVTMELSPGEESAVREKMADYNNRRRSKQPLELPSAGSVFKRPEGHYAGRLIEEAGLKGARIGDAQVSEKHAGFIVNLGKATARDVLALIALVREEVFKKFGVSLEPEVRVIGEE